MRLLLLSLLFLTGCATQPQLMMWTPPASAWEAARSQGARFDRENGGSHFVHRRKVEHLVIARDRIGAVSGMTPSLAIFDTQEPNAHAFKHNGIPTIGLTLGLWDLIGDDPDAIAAIVGHEIAHLHLGHDPAEQQRREAQASGLGQAAGVVAETLVPFSSILVQAGITAYARSFSRDEEREADKYGLGWITAAGYDPCGQVRVIQKIEGAGGATLPFLSTHPSYTERAEAAKAIAARAGRTC